MFEYPIDKKKQNKYFILFSKTYSDRSQASFGAPLNLLGER